MRIAVICVGNQLMLDDGLGVEVYHQVKESYELPENVSLECAGCMTLDMIGAVDEYDVIISVDAIDETGHEPGTVFRYAPDDIARRGTPMGSLHELKLADLFDAAALLGYTCKGVCLGMQVENASPSEFFIGLTPVVWENLPRLIDTLLAELVGLGCEIRLKGEGTVVEAGFHHTMIEAQHA